MSAGNSEGQLLYSVNNIKAYHVSDGTEHPITTSGPQTLSLLMVPTSSRPAGAGTTPEEDFYLHLTLPPELDLPLPATTQVYHQPPTSYLIPRWDLGTEAGVFIRLEFPSIGTGPGKVTQDDIDTFETILAQCTAFLERAPPPKSYNPAAYAPGEGYVGTTGKTDMKANNDTLHPAHGQIVLIDEDNGSVIGELENFDVVESAAVRPGSKTPVEIQLPGEGQGNKIEVVPVSEQYLEMARHPAFAKSTLVQTSAKASRLLVTGSNYLAKTMSSSAENFTKSTQPNAKPMEFSPTTHSRARQIHNFTHGAVGISAKTVGQVGKYAQNLGAAIVMRGEQSKSRRGYDKDGNIDPGYKPGILNKSMIAFSTIADGVEFAGKTLLATGATATTQVVGHKYGKQAGDLSHSVTGGVQNVGLVYIDAMGVSRKAIIKSVAKGMIVGKMPNGQNLVVGGGDGGQIPTPGTPPRDAKGTFSKTNTNQSGPPLSQASSRTDYSMEGYGNAKSPPAYPGIGDPIEGQRAPEKR